MSKWQKWHRCVCLICPSAGQKCFLIKNYIFCCWYLSSHIEFTKIKMTMKGLMFSRFYIRSFHCDYQRITTKSQTRNLRQCRIWNEKRFPQNMFLASRTYAETKTINCWSCHRPLDACSTGTKESFFCSSCGSLQEINKNYVSKLRWWTNALKHFTNFASSQNFFSLFGIPETFHINQNELTKHFRQFQSVLHPDKFSKK